MVEKQEIQGWEQQINRSKARIRTEDVTEQHAIREMEEKENKREGELQEGWVAWNIWAEQRRKVAKMVTRDKKAHVDNLIKKIGTPEGPENRWKAIETLAPRSRQNKRALEKEDGGICFNKEEEIEELKRYCQKHLGQKEHQPNIEEEHATPANEEYGDAEQVAEERGAYCQEEPEDDTRPLRAQIREAFRHTHHTKSTPEWSIPTKMYVIAEEQLVRPIQQMWQKWGTKTHTQRHGRYKKRFGYQSQETRETKSRKEEG